MGEYFAAYLKTGRTKPRVYACSGDLKQMEHCYIGNAYVNYVLSELLDTPTTVAWIGDYAEDYTLAAHGHLTEEQYKKAFEYTWCNPKPNSEATWNWNNYHDAMAGIEEDGHNPYSFSYIINDMKKCYISLSEVYDAVRKDFSSVLVINPLCLLTASYPSGYRGINSDKIGSWAFDTILVTLFQDEIPSGYTNVSLQSLFAE